VKVKVGSGGTGTASRVTVTSTIQRVDINKRLSEGINESAQQAADISPGWSEAKPGNRVPKNYQARVGGRRKLIVAVVLYFLSLSLACKSGPNGVSPATSSSPTAISSSAQVVKISTQNVSMTANGSGEATVTLFISPGFHINANPATFPYLIPTEVQPAQVDGLTVDRPVYPPAVKKTFPFAEKPLDVYEGKVSIKLPLQTTSGAKNGQQSLPIKVRVQACDNEKCFPPSTLDSQIAITVK